MLGSDDDVDVVLGLEAVIHAGEKTVSIRRKVEADDIRLLVGDVIHEAGILMGEAVVVLLPDGGS